MLYLDSNSQVAAEQWLPPDLTQLRIAGQQHPASYPSLREDILQLSRRLIQQSSEQQDDSNHSQLLVVQGAPLILVISSINNNRGTNIPIGNIVAGHFLESYAKKIASEAVKETHDDAGATSETNCSGAQSLQKAVSKTIVGTRALR